MLLLLQCGLFLCSQSVLDGKLNIDNGVKLNRLKIQLITNKISTAQNWGQYKQKRGLPKIGQTYFMRIKIIIC